MMEQKSVGSWCNRQITTSYGKREVAKRVCSFISSFHTNGDGLAAVDSRLVGLAEMAKNGI